MSIGFLKQELFKTNKCCFLLLVLLLRFLWLRTQNGFQFANNGVEGFDVTLDFS